MKEVAAVRRELGVRSIFNILGPLANPAGAQRQLLGVYDRALLPIMAGALASLGTERSLVVHGDDGLDEVSPSGPTQAIMVEKGAMTPLTIFPEDVGLVPRAYDLGGGGPAENARMLRGVLSGQSGPARDAVVLNAAAALWVAGVGADLATSADTARAILDDGGALAKLDALARMTTYESCAEVTCEEAS
jgi:anthranilate phosphoribosyltransferase